MDFANHILIAEPYLYFMKRIFLAFLTIMIVTTSIQAQGKNDYYEMLNQLLEVTGSTASTDLVMVKMIEAIKMEYPEVKEEDWKNLEIVVNKSRLEYREKKLVPLYQKYLTTEDLEELINFYHSPVGQKYAKAAPQLSIEANRAGMEWGQQLGKTLEKEIRKLDR